MFQALLESGYVLFLYYSLHLYYLFLFWFFLDFFSSLSLYYLFNLVFITLVFSALVSITFYIFLDILSSLLLLFSSQFQDCSKPVTSFTRLYSILTPLLYWSLFSFYTLYKIFLVMNSTSRIQHGVGLRVWWYNWLCQSSLSQCLM